MKKPVDPELIVIAGAGAVGSYLAAKLSQRHKVLALARGEHLEALKANGLRLGGDEDTLYKFDVASELTPLPRKSLVLVTAKTTHLEGIVESLKPALSEDTLVVLTANGYDPEKRFSRLLGQPVARILVSLGCHLVKAGMVEFWGGGGVQVSGDETGRMVRQVLEEADLLCEMAEDFHTAVWLKLAANCVINPLTALLRVRNREIVTPELAAARRAVLDEVTAVAAADSARLPEDFPETLDEFISKSNNVSSMLQDVMRRRRTEIDDINGAVVRLAEEKGLSAQVNASLVSLIKGLEQTYLAGNEQAGRT